MRRPFREGHADALAATARPVLSRPAARAYLGFATFGAFWGTWGASIPAVRDQADISEGQLGTALLFIGAGALPAMLMAGRLVDRWGQRTVGPLLLALGSVGLFVAATGRDLVTLSAGLAVLGGASGAADVAINASAGSAQRSTGRPIISRSHAVFSTGVVAASLGTGALHERGGPLIVPFAVLAAAAAAVALMLIGLAAPGTRPVGLTGPPNLGVEAHRMRLTPLLVLGVLGALAFAVENGHQSWSALYLSDILDAGPATAATGPAVFAAVVATTRFTTSGLATRHPAALLLLGSVVAAVGTAMLTFATTVASGLLGLGIAAAGTAVLFPTLLSVLTAHVPGHTRGTATSIVTAVAYLGFLGGPAYVGFWAGAIELRGAMTALAILAVVLAIVSPQALRTVAKPQPVLPTISRVTEQARRLPGAAACPRRR